MMGRTYYIGWYISKDDKQLFKGNVPGNLKMTYVIDQIKLSGITPEIVSLARQTKVGYYKQLKVSRQSCNVTYFAGFNGSSRFAQLLDFIFRRLQLLKLLVFEVSRKDHVILYHSYPFTKFISKLNVVLKRHIILEVEEIYGYNAVEDKPWVKNEIASIKKMTDYICVNDGIHKLLGVPKENTVTSYGVGVIPERKVERRNDGKIHVVYAGTIEAYKLGAMTAVEASRFVSSDYVIHIIGFGKEEHIQLLKNRIDEINMEKGEVRVEYNGYKSGLDLDNFLFGCHIGLSSNVMRPNFANNSFPSKVITYMCHDLSVVLGYADAFYDVPPMSDGWTFYKEFTPECIARAIMCANVREVGFYHEAITQMNADLQTFFRKKLL